VRKLATVAPRGYSPALHCLCRLPAGSTLSMTDSVGNHTVCQLDEIGGANGLPVVTIAGDGMLLVTNVHGELSLLA
jgi:hypothetical protein